MNYTGERFIPSENENSLMALEHMHRYTFVLPHIKNKKCLDIACGEGYGSVLMAEHAAEVLGCDVDEEAVKWAKTKYQKKNLFFQQCDIVTLPFEDKTFDIITCFETIEHITFDAQKKAFNELKRVLKDDGILFISTPNVASSLYIKNNKYHKHEMRCEEFVKVLEDYFHNVVCLGQSICCSSVISVVGKRDLAYYFENDNFILKDDKYTISVCSNAALPEFSYGSVYSDSTNDFFCKLTKIRNAISWGIPIYNFGIQFLSALIPFKKLKCKIRSLKW